MGLSEHLIVYCSRRISKGHFKHHNTCKTTKVRSLKNHALKFYKQNSYLKNGLHAQCFKNCVNEPWKKFQRIYNRVLD